MAILWRFQKLNDCLRRHKHDVSKIRRDDGSLNKWLQLVFMSFSGRREKLCSCGLFSLERLRYICCRRVGFVSYFTRMMRSRVRQGYEVSITVIHRLDLSELQCRRFLILKNHASDIIGFRLTVKRMDIYIYIYICNLFELKWFPWRALLVNYVRWNGRQKVDASIFFEDDERRFNSRQFSFISRIMIFVIILTRQEYWSVRVGRVDDALELCEEQLERYLHGQSEKSSKVPPWSS